MTSTLPFVCNAGLGIILSCRTDLSITLPMPYHADLRITRAVPCRAVPCWRRYNPCRAVPCRSVPQETVDDSEPFPAVLAAFEAWHSAQLPADSRSLFVTYGDWDLKTMLPSQCRLSGVTVPGYMGAWCNTKHVSGGDKVEERGVELLRGSQLVGW